MLNLWRWLARRCRWRTEAGIEIPAALWQQTMDQYPFLGCLSSGEQTQLRKLCHRFLATKEFHGAQGLEITDPMALAIAAQACLPVLHLAAGTAALAWYDDFVGIVVHPDEVLAQREVTDEAGVVHRFNEVLAGEAMQDGPVMLSWQDVTAASSELGYNVVIHEFVHKLDLRDGLADGCPPLQAGFMGAPSARAARQRWLDTLEFAYHDFREQVIRAERFGAESPWLDAYGAHSIDEFFAVASEAYFVNRERFALDFAPLLPLFDSFFHRAKPQN